jgi:hypothetical protein
MEVWISVRVQGNHKHQDPNVGEADATLEVPEQLAHCVSWGSIALAMVQEAMRQYQKNVLAEERQEQEYAEEAGSE